MEAFIASPTWRSSMSVDKKKPGAEGTEEHIFSEKGAWKNTSSPTGEDTRPSIAVSFDDLWDEFPEEGDEPGCSDLEQPG
jgi:hypothetical protein